MKTLILITTCLLAPWLSANITFETTVVDGGKANLDDKMFVAEFPFINTGEKTVTLLSIDSSCGCTVAETEKKTYAPGESGVIKASFDFGVRTGQQTKQIRVVTDGQPQQRIDLVLKIDIPQVLSIKPRVLFWEDEEEPKPQTITVTVDQSVASPNIRIEPESKGRFDVVLTPAPEGSEGNYLITATPTSIEQGRERLKVLALDGQGKVISEQFAFMIVRKAAMPRNSAARAPVAP